MYVIWWIVGRKFTIVAFYIKSPIFIAQRAYIPKNGAEFRQQTSSDNRTGVAASYDLVRRLQKRRTDIHTYTHTHIYTEVGIEFLLRN